MDLDNIFQQAAANRISSLILDPMKGLEIVTKDFTDMESGYHERLHRSLGEIAIIVAAMKPADFECLKLHRL